MTKFCDHDENRERKIKKSGEKRLENEKRNEKKLETRKGRKGGEKRKREEMTEGNINAK